MDIYGIILTIIGSSSVSVVVIETFRNWLFKRREEYVELAKHKIDTISKSIPYYMNLARNSWNFGWESIESEEQQDSKRLLYYLANMLYYREKINETVGQVQLDNLDAERILHEIWHDIGLECQLGSVDSSRLSCLATVPYHEFYERVTEPEKLISLLTNNNNKDVFEKCMWFSQLLMFELNHIYKPWYGEEPRLVLRDRLKGYLQSKYPDYYNRIKSFTK